MVYPGTLNPQPSFALSPKCEQGIRRPFFDKLDYKPKTATQGRRRERNKSKN